MKKIAAAIAVAIVLAAAGAYLYRGTQPDRALAAQGTVRAVSTVQVRAPLGGQLKEIAADFKTPVKIGQVLARIDATAYEQRVNQARADLDAARAAKATATVRQREQLLKQAQLDLEQTVIRAPVDGTVILRNADVGQTIAAGTQAFTIAPDLRTVHVEVALDAEHAARLKRGMTVTFSVDALPRRRFSGQVLEVRKGSPAAIVITASNADLALVPGMTANVRIPRAP
jgi:HlyD family secretion protein